MFCIGHGQLDKHARREIVQATALQILRHCKYPTSKQVQVVASKIVATIPGTKDFLGVGHVSIAN